MPSLDVRHEGRFVARATEETEELTRASAERIAKATGLENVTIEPGKKFELHNRDGFIDSFDTADQAGAVMDDLKKKHADHVKRGGPDSLARARRSRGIKSPLSAMQAKEDPGLVIKEAD